MVFSKMRKASKVVLVIVILGFAASGLYAALRSRYSGSGAEGRVVVTVNGTPIYDHILTQQFNMELMYANYYQSMFGYGEVSWLSWEAMKYDVLTRLIAEELLMQKAKADKIKVTNAEVEAELSALKAQYGEDLGTPDSVVKEHIRAHLPAEKLLQQIESSVEVTDEDLVRAYEEVNARHILISTDGRDEDEARALAEELLARAQAGEDFAVLAEEYSDDPGSRFSGGELGYFSRGMMVPEFEEAAFSTEVGGYALVQTTYGFHVINVLNRKEAVGPEFEEAKEELKQSLLSEKVGAKINELIEELWEQAEIVYQDRQMEGRYLYLKGDFEGAIEAYNAAMKANPQEFGIYPSLAEAYARTENLEKAVEIMQACVEQLSGSSMVAEAYVLLGQYHMLQEEEDLAAQSFVKASDADQYDLMLHYTLQAVLAQMGRTEELEVINQRIEAIYAAYEQMYEQQELAETEDVDAVEELEVETEEEVVVEE